MTRLLEVTSLVAGYNGNPVVRNLNLTVEAGQVVALLGPNGAGKTTTLMTIAGALRPLDGHVEFDGSRTVEPLHAMARRGLSIVPESRSVFMGLTARENLRLGRGQIDKALSMFPELVPLLGRKGGQLSGGEQQMLALARALSRTPKLLLADELSLGLAPIIVQRLLGVVREQADKGLGVLIVEQHVHQALRVADHVSVLNRGSVVLSGSSREIGPDIEVAYLDSQRLRQA
jgi:branched-chain amino acid transport system ATP-binding protein